MPDDPKLSRVDRQVAPPGSIIIVQLKPSINSRGSQIICHNFVVYLVSSKPVLNPFIWRVQRILDRNLTPIWNREKQQ